MGAKPTRRGGYQVAEDWEGRFACTLPGAQLAWWDLDHGTPQELASGMRRCRECPIATQCLEEAIRKRESGVFGGRVVVAGSVKPLARWLARRLGKRPGISAGTVVGQRNCEACGTEFDVIAPAYPVKFCGPCRALVTSRASAERSARRRAQIAARALEEVASGA